MEQTEKLLQILDMNVNRACEGIRVVEDFSRVNNWECLTSKLASIRHSLRETLSGLDANLINSRRISSDENYNQHYSAHSNIYSLLTANFKRASEAIRNLEEYSRLNNDIKEVSIFRKNRYKCYECEHELTKKYYSNFFVTELYPVVNENHCYISKKMGHHHYKLLQYRNKSSSLKEKIEDILLIKDFLKHKDVLLVINDDVQLAWKTKSIAIHLGQKDLKNNLHQWEKLKSMFPIIGVSCSNEREIIAAMALKPDYIGLGAVWETKNKPDATVVGLEMASRLFNKYNSLIPIVLIGGFSLTRLKEIKMICPSLKIISGIDLFANVEDIGIRRSEILDILQPNSLK